MNSEWDDIFEKSVRSALTDYPADAPLEADTPLPAFGLDSLGMIALAATLESSYGFTFPDGALVPATFATAGGLWEAVRSARPGGLAARP